MGVVVVRLGVVVMVGRGGGEGVGGGGGLSDGTRPLKMHLMAHQTHTLKDLMKTIIP